MKKLTENIEVDDAMYDLLKHKARIRSIYVTEPEVMKEAEIYCKLNNISLSAFIHIALRMALTIMR